MRQWRVQVFCEPPFRGNQAIVQIYDSALSHEEMAQLAREADAPVTCFIWPGAKRFEAHCYSVNGSIHCCGHGLLAAAHVLHSQRYAGCCESFELFSGGSLEPLRVELHRERLWLWLPRLRCTETAVPLWAKEAFHIQPVKAAVAGDAGNYLVLEYADSIRLSRLEVLHSQITANTSRAVIVTAQAACKGYHFVLRYFAPQYGTDEDAVTGSAARVLADYWELPMNTQHFRALQCSAAGGVIACWLRPDSVGITGRVTID